MPDKEQAERIADIIASVSQEYEHFKKDNIKEPEFDKSTTPHIPIADVYESLMTIKTKKSTAPGVVPAKLIKRAAEHLSAPLADIIYSGIRLGDHYSSA